EIQSLGAHIQLYTWSFDEDGRPLSLPDLQLFEAFCQANYPYVRDWTYVSYPLHVSNPKITATQISNLARLPSASASVSVVAVSPNFFELYPRANLRSATSSDGVVGVDVMSTMNVIGETDPALNGYFPSVSEQLYTPKGQHSVLMSTFLKETLAVPPRNTTDSSGITRGSSGSDFNSRMLLRTTWSTYPYVTYNDTLVKPLGFLDTTGYVRTSAYPSTVSGLSRSSMLVSFPTMADLLSDGAARQVASVDDVAVNVMLISVDVSQGGMGGKGTVAGRSIATGTSTSSSASSDAIYYNSATKRFEALVRGFQDLARTVYFRRNINIEVKNIHENLSGLRTSQSVISMVFTLATAVVLLLAMFSLNTVMVANIMEQRREIGVWRALGVRSWIVMCCFVAEAFVVIVASGLLG
ncbi:hypothetical protein HK102_008711, partial [Quaeritorhiza haematococci]